MFLSICPKRWTKKDAFSYRYELAPPSSAHPPPPRVPQQRARGQVPQRAEHPLKPRQLVKRLPRRNVSVSQLFNVPYNFVPSLSWQTVEYLVQNYMVQKDVFSAAPSRRALKPLPFAMPSTSASSSS
jgi:hypothetical protein